MKDKEMIEEMAKVMADCNITCNECFEQFESTLTMKIKNRAEHCQAYMFAKRAIEKGWGKIGKNSVVLTKEEYELLTNDLDKHDYGEFESGYSQGSKETAEKIFNSLIKEIDKRKSCGNADVVVYELAKQFGVEIKE